MKLSFFLTASGPNFRAFQWSFNQPPEKMVRGFNLYYWPVTNAVPEKVNDKIIDGYSYRHLVPNYSKFSRGYYSVEIVYCDGTCERSRIYDLFNVFNRQILNIIRRELWELMSKAVPLNLGFVLFQKRTTGTPCPKCTVNYRIGNVQHKCPVCLGTGYKYGYYFPSFLCGEYSSPFQESESLSPIGKLQDSTVTLKTIAFFGLLRFGDMIKEMNSPYRLFSISSIVKTDAVSQPITYQLGLMHVESHHPLYMIEVPNADVLFNKPISYLNVWKEYDTILSKFKEQFAGLPQSKLFTEDHEADPGSIESGPGI